MAAVRLRPLLCLFLLRTGDAVVRAPTGPTEVWSAAKLISASFAPSRSPLAVGVSLYAPWLDAHAFCAPSATDAPLIAVVRGGVDDGVVGVAQAMLVRLRPSTGIGDGRRVAFLQNIAVAPSCRRQGIASRLVADVERQAATNWGVDEAWLAAAEEDESLRLLYEGLGYECTGRDLGQVLMQKRLRADEDCAPAYASPTEVSEPPSRAPDAGGISVGALAKEVAVQGMYFGIGCLGISCLVQPFGGTGLSEQLPSAGAPLATVGEAALGLGLAAAELARLGAWPAAGADRLEPLTPGQASQLAPLWRIAGREPNLTAALAAIGAWQLSIALAEEVYYRGLVLSGLRSGLQGLAGLGLPVAPPAASLLALALSSAVFGAVHLEFASAAEPGDAAAGGDGERRDSAARWFGVTAAYGAAYGALFLATGLHLLAPVCLHGGINTGLCVGRWRQVRNMDGAEAERLFAEDEDEDEAVARS